MDLTTYVQHLRQEFASAAELGGEETRAMAERLAAPLESAIQLTLLNALSAAADEITRDLAPGSVDLRLRGGDPDFIVTPPPSEDSFDGTDDHADETPSAPAAVLTGEDGATSRINFRPPEQLKIRIEEAATREGLSVNAWLIRVVAAALEPDRGHRGARRAPRGRQRYTGWVR
jgi:hypothetical protein